MDEIVKWVKLTHILSIYLYALEPPFAHLTLLHIHIREKAMSLPYVYYVR